MYAITLALIVALSLPAGHSQQLTSPCPTVFNYGSQTEAGKWSGNVQITTEFDLSGIWLRIGLDKPAIALTSSFGEAVVRDDGYLLKNPTTGLKPGEVKSFWFTVQYDPSQAPPKITNLRLNGKVFCQAPKPVNLTPLESPCPLIFNYEPQTEPDRYYGNVKISTEQELNGIWLRVLIDGASTELKTEFGEAAVRDDGYLVKNPKHHLAPGTEETIRFYVRYNPSQPAPKIKGFRLNAKTICSPGDAGTAAVTRPKESIADLVSPCPDLFQYEKTSPEPDRWYGSVTLQTDSELRGIWLRIIFDRPSVQLGNWFGEVDTKDNKEYLIKNPTFALKPGTNVPVRFFVKYDTNEPIPKLLAYRINAKTVCQLGTLVASPQPILPVVRPVINPQPSSTVGSIEDVLTWINQPTEDPGASDDEEFFHSEIRPGGSGLLTPAGGNGVQCGTVVTKPRPLITYGLDTFEGQYPWHAALYHSKGIDLTYICGASLISQKHVITVGHCVARKKSAVPLSPERLAVYLGKFYLTRWNTPGIQEFKVQKISMHTNYNPNTFKDDIAILHLSKPVMITDYVRPICLWSDNSDLNQIIDKVGIVVGWGYDQNGRVTEQLTQASMPVVSQQTCIWSYPDFFSKFTSDNTFCAGFRNGTSVCNGDSGGGLVFPKKSAGGSTIWYLRGLVSISVALQHKFCDNTHYVVFTDSAKYANWISTTMAQN